MQDDIKLEKEIVKSEAQRFGITVEEYRKKYLSFHPLSEKSFREAVKSQDDLNDLYKHLDKKISKMSINTKTGKPVIVTTYYKKDLTS